MGISPARTASRSSTSASTARAVGSGASSIGTWPTPSSTRSRASGTVAATFTVTGDATKIGATNLVGTVAATSSVTGAASVIRLAAGAVAATSSISGAVAAFYAAAGVVAAVSTVTGDATGGEVVEEDEGHEYAPTIGDPDTPTLTLTGRTLMSVAVSLPTPVLVDGRPT